MDQQFLSLFQSAKKSADIVATSASIFPEVHRCLDALDQLKRFPVTSSRVLVSTLVAREVQYLKKHRVKMIRTAASCLLDTWSRKLYARNPAVDGKTQPTEGRCGSRTGTLVVKIQGRVIGRVKVNMPIKTTEKKIEGEKENGFSCIKKPPQEPARVKVIVPIKSTEKKIEGEKENGFSRFKKPPQEPARVKVNMHIKTEKKIQGEKKNGFSCFKEPPQESAMRCTKPEKDRSMIRRCFNKPLITQHENVKDFCSFKKPPQEPAMRCTKPEKDRSIRPCFKKPRITQQENMKDFCSFKKPPQEPAMRCTKPGELRSIRRCFKKPSTERITQQENVKDFCSSKKPSKEPVKCSDGLRSKVRHILLESLCRVAREVKDNLIEAVSLRDPICVAADVESVMFENMGPFSGTKRLKYRSILYNMKDPKNPDLRRKVLLGQIKPEKLVTMTSEEMASNQRHFENEQIRKKSLWKEMKNVEQEHKSVDPMEH